MTSTDILAGMDPIIERDMAPAQQPLDLVAATDEPFVIRGLASQWGVVQKANISNSEVFN